ncbi:Rieske 2Fe-2S domain-containing protein [Pseudonocardia ailaonensis]|uniref:cholesterol 7-desaturase n=1 Tax=Pseudonocardia ailaonensis TaxID=367279 RepID=A0ABN2MIV7_9PSEU
MTTDPVDTEIPVTPLSVPGSRYPTGWFQVAWSDDIKPGGIKQVSYFGTKIVLWRGNSGELFASDPYCLHLGGNLAVNGEVSGDEIVCPWHHWHWNGEGRNTLIPYSKQTCKPNLKLRTWHLREWNGIVLLWHDVGRCEPTWEPPVYEGLGTDDYFPFTEDRRYQSRIVAHPQMIVENGADPAHVMYIHGGGEMPEYDNITVDGPLWSADVMIAYGAGKESTWLTPDGGMQVKVGFRNYGLGLGGTLWPKEFMSAVMLMCNTPVDETHTDQFFCITGKKSSPEETEAPRRLVRFFQHQKHTNEQDYFTWEHMKVVGRPNLAPEEALPLASLRRWAWQFYPHLEQPAPRVPSSNGTDGAGHDGTNGAAALGTPAKEQASL